MSVLRADAASTAAASLSGPIGAAVVALLLASDGLIGEYAFCMTIITVAGLLGRAGTERQILIGSSAAPISVLSVVRLCAAVATSSAAVSLVAMLLFSTQTDFLDGGIIGLSALFAAVDSARETASEAVRGTGRLVSASASSRGARSILHAVFVGALVLVDVPSLWSAIALNVVAGLLTALVALIETARRVGVTEFQARFSDVQLMFPGAAALILQASPLWIVGALAGDRALDQLAIAIRIAAFTEVPLHALISLSSHRIASSESVFSIRTSLRTVQMTCVAASVLFAAAGTLAVGALFEQPLLPVAILCSGAVLSVALGANGTLLLLRGSALKLGALFTAATGFQIVLVVAVLQLRLEPVHSAALVANAVYVIVLLSMLRLARIQYDDTLSIRKSRQAA